VDDLLDAVAGSLLGYRSSPSLAEAISYMGYLVVVVILMWWTSRVPPPAAQQA
jgi:high-affinity Fe2+/Pb2+ permease